MPHVSQPLRDMGTPEATMFENTKERHEESARQRTTPLKPKEGLSGAPGIREGENIAFYDNPCNPRTGENLPVCFSATANFVGSTVLGAVGVVPLTKVKHRRELLFAALPLLFAIHQFIEGFVWLE